MKEYLSEEFLKSESWKRSHLHTVRKSSFQSTSCPFNLLEEIASISVAFLLAVPIIKSSSFYTPEMLHTILVSMRSKLWEEKHSELNKIYENHGKFITMLMFLRSSELANSLKKKTA